MLEPFICALQAFFMPDILTRKRQENKVRNFLITLCILAGTLGVYGQQQVTGTIFEEVNGEKMPLPFANVFIPGTTRGATSDFDGKYTIEVFENDTLIKVSYMGYNDVLKGIDPMGAELTVDVLMSGDAALQLDAVTVTAKRNMANENMLLLDQKKAVVVKESIGAKQLSNMGISDAAGATAKISGVTKNEGSGDIYVRGLGDRYLSTTMNGLPIPSDDVEKKNIDLNLFPTDVIKNVSISKTYDVSSYGDQASGHVDVSSKTYSETISVGISGGINGNVAGQFGSFKGTQNLNDATWGFYAKPYETVDAVKQQSWNTVDKKAPLDFGFSMMGGKKWESDGSTFSLFATLSSDVESSYREGVFRKYRSNVLNNEFTDATYYETEYNTTGLLNATYELGQKMTINYNGIWIAKTKDQLYEAGRNGEGFVFDQDPSEEGAFVRDQNLKVTNMFINQIIGEHKSVANTLNWALGYNKVNADEPNRIRNEVNMPHAKNDLDAVQFAHVGDYQQRKTYQNISDNEFNGYLKDQYSFVDEDEQMLKLNMGVNFRKKQRDFESQFVGVRAKGQQVSSIDNMDEALLNTDLYTDGDLTLREGTPDSYNATLDVYAGFASVDFQKSDLSGNLGLRYEYDNINVDWNVGNYVGREGNVAYDYKNFLPSLNMKYSLSEKNLIRFAASKTVTLPEFKELAPFEYVSPTGRVTKGNPDLKSSTDYNIDLKYEMYMRPKELISLSAFAKIINDPINLAQTRGSSGYFYYANTGEQATVYGLELEGRVNIINAVAENEPSLRLSFNLTKMWFSQDLLDEFQYNSKTEIGLQGASDFIVNGGLTFSNNKENEFMATLSANYSSDKIYALGSPEDYTNSDQYFNNEIIEKGFVSMDLILKKKISKRVSAKLYGKNLLNPEIQWTQMVEPLSSDVSTDEIVESYRKGAEVGLGLTINLN